MSLVASPCHGPATKEMQFSTERNASFLNYLAELVIFLQIFAKTQQFSKKIGELSIPLPYTNIFSISHDI